MRGFKGGLDVANISASTILKTSVLSSRPERGSRGGGMSSGKKTDQRKKSAFIAIAVYRLINYEVRGKRWRGKNSRFTIEKRGELA